MCRATYSAMYKQVGSTCVANAGGEAYIPDRMESMSETFA